jgi:hypothetical protein
MQFSIYIRGLQKKITRQYSKKTQEVTGNYQFVFHSGLGMKTKRKRGCCLDLFGFNRVLQGNHAWKLLAHEELD